MYIVKTIYHNLHIKNGPYQSFQKDPAIRIKAETFKESKSAPAPRFFHQLKMLKQGVCIHRVSSYSAI